MKITITSTDDAVNQIRTEITRLEQEQPEGYEETISTLNSRLDELNQLIFETNRAYSAQIEERISALTETDLAELMETQGLTFEQAKDYIFNEIMSQNGDNLEAYYESMEVARNNGVTPNNVTLFNTYVSRLVELRSIFSKRIAEIKSKKQMSLTEYDRLTKTIGELDKRISLLASAHSASEHIVAELDNEEITNLAYELSEIDTRYNQTDKDGIGFTVEMLELRKEKGLKKFLHRGKRTSVREQINCNLKNLEELKRKKGLVNKEISEAARIMWSSLSLEEREAFITLATTEAFKDQESIQAYLAAAITSKDASLIQAYNEQLAIALKTKQEQRQSLSEERAPHEKTKNIIDDIEANPHFYMSALNMTLEQQMAFEVIAREYPFLISLSDAELQTIKDAKLIPSTMVITPAKVMTKVKER